MDTCLFFFYYDPPSLMVTASKELPDTYVWIYENGVKEFSFIAVLSYFFLF